MNEEITANLNYEWAKTEITKELQTEANSFIRVGWIFKMVRDGKIETPYGSVTEFAEKEWNLGKDVVSRYMRINDHFSINGYSEKIAPQYGSFGYSKLAIMLTLPDEINEELSSEYSKADIQAIKDEIDAEQKITPLEVMAEPAPDQPETDKDEFLALIVKQLNDEHPTPITLIHQIREDGLVSSDDVMDAYRPDGDKVYIIRISGQGRFTVTMKADRVSIVNARTFEKSVVNWDEWMDFVLDDEENREYKPEVIHEASKKKVEKSSASVQKTGKSVQKEPENVSKAEETEEKVEKADDVEIEKVEGEVIDDPETQQNTLADDDQPLPENTAQSTEQYITSEDAGQYTDNAPQNVPYPDGEEPEITHVSSEDPLPKETDTAASEDAESEAGAAGDEDILIDKLEELISPTECYRIREMVKEMDSVHGYREKLDQVSEWIAQLYTVSGKLYAKLASRGL